MLSGELLLHCGPAHSGWPFFNIMFIPIALELARPFLRRSPPVDHPLDLPVEKEAPLPSLSNPSSMSLSLPLSLAPSPNLELTRA